MQINLYKALLEAQKSLSGVSKDSNNEFANYKYVSAEGMVNSARKVLFDNGLITGRKSWSYSPEPDGTYRVKSVFFVSHPESGEADDFNVELPAVTRKGIPQDKAVACALTSSLSYFLRDLLMLPRFDSGENMDERNDKAEAFIDELNLRLGKTTIL